MEKNNVNVLCENSPYKNTKEQYSMSTGTDLKEFVKYFDHPLFHVCWDTGHGNFDGNQYDEIVNIGDDLFALHINDNSGYGDEHILPYLGTINMDEIINALIDINYNRYFTFECCTSLRPSKHIPGDRKNFERDTRLCDPVLFMQKHLEKLMYEMGEYFLKSYNCFEK